MKKSNLCSDVIFPTAPIECGNVPQREPIDLVGPNSPQSTQLKSVNIEEMPPEVVANMKALGIQPFDHYPGEQSYYTDGQGNYFGQKPSA